jgi:hypothetical protein
MTAKEHDLGPAIGLLEDRYMKAQAAANELLGTLNFLRKEAGLPPRPPGIEGNSEGGTVLSQIRRDSFYGKKQMTAIREYLAMRRAQGDGPATPREILDALKAGGYKFDTKTDDIALVGVRALLRKANTVFHRLPDSGAYGLLAWYPDAKPSKDDDEGEAAASAPTKPRRGRPPKSAKQETKKRTVKLKQPRKVNLDLPEQQAETETAAD